MYFWYQFLTYLFYPFSKVYLFCRKLNKKEHPIRYKEKLSDINIDRDNGFLVWFHVVSVGEGLSILPLVENFKNDSSSGVVIEKEAMLYIKNPIIVIEITLAMDVLSSNVFVFRK